MCSAMPRRIAFIGSTVSPAPAAAGSGAAWRLWRGGAACGAGAAAGRSGSGWAERRRLGGAAGAAGSGSLRRCFWSCGRRPDSTNDMMSFLVTRPPRPVPCTWPTSTPCSEAIRATTGETNVFSPAPSLVSAAAGAAPERAAAGTGGGAAVGVSPSELEGAAASAAASCVAGSGGACGGLGLGLGFRSSLGSRDLGSGRRDHRELRPDLDRLAFLHEDLLDDALAGARNLGVDLVGRDLEQRLVGGDLLAFLLEPLRDRPLGDRDAHLGHHDVDRRSGGHVL